MGKAEKTQKYTWIKKNGRNAKISKFGQICKYMYIRTETFGNLFKKLIFKIPYNWSNQENMLF
jgi:hypothetical protein